VTAATAEAGLALQLIPAAAETAEPGVAVRRRELPVSVSAM